MLHAVTLRSPNEHYQADPTPNQPRPIVLEQESLDLWMLVNSVRDLTATESFYQGLLGFKTRSMGDRELVMYLGDCQFLFLTDPSTSKEYTPQPFTTINSEVDHWAFGIHDLKACEDYLVNNDIEYLKLRVPQSNTDQLFLHDPDHHTIELVHKKRGTLALGSPPFDSRTSRLGITALDHISRVTDQVPRDIQFLMNNLRLKPIARPPFEVGGAWFKAKTVEVHLVAGKTSPPAVGSGTDLWVFKAQTGKEVLSDIPSRCMAANDCSMRDELPRKLPLKPDASVIERTFAID